VPISVPAGKHGIGPKSLNPGMARSTSAAFRISSICAGVNSSPYSTGIVGMRVML
jgi:hypothetical protein